jgi:CBS domain containing-hemolysin-like protein
METQIAIIVISMLLSAFFSGMEIAFVSANKLHLELEKKKDSFIAGILRKLTKKSSRFITTMLVGNNITLVIYSMYMGDFLIGFLPIETWNEITVLIIQTLISTILILVSAEFLPKAIFRIYANEALNFFAIPAYFFYIVLYFFSTLISEISDFFLQVFFKTNSGEEQTEFSREELGNYINEQMKIGNVDDEVDSEIQIFKKALEFHKVKAREIMVPRTEMMAVDIHETIPNLRKIFTETGCSKIVVYKNSLDDIIGYVNAFELFKKPETIRSVLLPIEVVPESMIINNVLSSLIKKRKSIAIVLGEYGGTSGMITIEDIVEELFGEIEDEHDSQELLEERINAHEFCFSARLEVDYLNEEYDLNIPKEEAYETLGGFIINHTENIPELNEKIYIENFIIKILEVSSSKIEKISFQIIDAED